ncbi:MAG: 2-amino-4-hydroxy-6-hydroxymethyldihydropteridine diphosphokinase [Tannerellaceae bacterium]|nr:2-amino-4-hydroxy-6-hydroxymethyldihydropteridine diphosphokinase [Tannerellaceae bacterium]
MRTLLGLGSNLGNRRAFLVRAAARLAECSGDLVILSSFYETVPWGYDSENHFLNAALLLETPLAPEELLSSIHRIENELGRQRTHTSYTDRTIDIDILLYDNIILHTPTLTIPHPLMHLRQFTLKPLVEIAPDYVHPVLQQTLLQLYETL